MPRAGDQIGEYRLESKLGHGGFAAVWSARADSDGREVALKILHADHLAKTTSRGPTIADRFIEEARLLQRLESPGLVRVHELIEDRDADLVAIAMERLHGRDLGTACGDLALNELLELFAQLAHTLGDLHDNGVIHRDVKPTNMFVCEDATPFTLKLLDLGIAMDQLMRRVEESTATGMILGTLLIMAPESVDRAAGKEIELTGAVDQWGLASSLFACVTGQPPFQGQGTWQLLHAIGEAPVPKLVLHERFAVASPPPSLIACIERCLAKRAIDRYASMAGVEHALRVAKTELVSDETRRLDPGPTIRLETPSQEARRPVIVDDATEIAVATHSNLEASIDQTAAEEPADPTVTRRSDYDPPPDSEQTEPAQPVLSEGAVDRPSKNPIRVMVEPESPSRWNRAVAQTVLKRAHVEDLPGSPAPIPIPTSPAAGDDATAPATRPVDVRSRSDRSDPSTVQLILIVAAACTVLGAALGWILRGS